MAYKCPRCGQDVQRSASTAAGVAGGAVGALLVAAFGSFQCRRCGTIANREFPAEDRKKMARGKIILIVSAIVLLLLAIVLIVLVQR